MGYLNKQTVTVDAILTKKGRQLLAQSRNAFAITKFAVADDEIDYGLYNPAHPLGSEYYGSVIENMPIIEATPDETQNLRYKLVTIPRGQGGTGVNIIPQIVLDITELTLTAGQAPSVNFTPSTSDGRTERYTITLFNSEAATIGGSSDAISGTISTITGTAAVLQTGADGAFRLNPKDVTTDTVTQVRVTGNDSGATVTFPLTVLAATT